jgi:hypothetical protein
MKSVSERIYSLSGISGRQRHEEFRTLLLKILNAVCLGLGDRFCGYSILVGVWAWAAGVFQSKKSGIVAPSPISWADCGVKPRLIALSIVSRLWSGGLRASKLPHVKRSEAANVQSLRN